MLKALRADRRAIVDSCSYACGCGVPARVHDRSADVCLESFWTWTRYWFHWCRSKLSTHSPHSCSHVTWTVSYPHKQNVDVTHQSQQCSSEMAFWLSFPIHLELTRFRFSEGIISVHGVCPDREPPSCSQIHINHIHKLRRSSCTCSDIQLNIWNVMSLSQHRSIRITLFSVSKVAATLNLVFSHSGRRRFQPKGRWSRRRC